MVIFSHDDGLSTTEMVGRIRQGGSCEQEKS